MFGGISMIFNAVCVCLVFTNVHAFLLPNETQCPAEAFTVAGLNSSKGGSVAGTSEKGTNECPCLTRACLSMCSPTMFRSSIANTSGIVFPTIYDPATLESRRGGIRLKDFHVVTWDPCHGGRKFKLTPEEIPEDEYKFLANGSIYCTVPGTVINYTDYCFGAIGGNSYSVVLCINETVIEAAKMEEARAKVDFPVGMIISMPFLLVTFVVYSVIPELRNVHGAILRRYVATLIVAFIVLLCLLMIPTRKISDSQCKSMAFVLYFFYLATFLWLNVMCIDIWSAFRGFKSLLANVKQQDSKTFIIYSIYAWGSATLLTGLCLIMDFVPSVPRSFIRPKFGASRCWFDRNSGQGLYFYGPIGLAVVCNICLFILATINIIQHKKDTAHHVKRVDSRRHVDNKQRFNLYLKLFIIMTLSWPMEIVMWLYEGTSHYIWYISDVANSFHGLLIFITFVWNGEVKRLLLKRLGCQDRSSRPENSTRSDGTSSTSKTSRTSAVTIPLQDKIKPLAERKKSTTDENDCV